MDYKASNPQRECINGKLMLNTIEKILSICVSGQWKKICYNLMWSSTQAMVACRQLHPEALIIGQYTYKLNLLRILITVFDMQKLIHKKHQMLVHKFHITSIALERRTN